MPVLVIVSTLICSCTRR